jgi:hypothetical protein
MIMIKFKPPSIAAPINQDHTSHIKFGQTPNTVTAIPSTPVHEHAIFSSSIDPTFDKVINYIKNNYINIFNDNERRIRNMVKQLLPCELNTIMGWGEDALIEQRDILKVVTSRMSEFSQLNGNELLQEVLNSANKANQTGLLQRLTNTLYKPQETYGNRVASLKIRLKGIFDPIQDYNQKIKDSTLPLWSATIAAVNECTTISDNTTDEAILNRRQLLRQALQNLQVAEAQLEQTKTLIVKQQTQVDYIMNVVLPSLDLAKP